MPTRREKSVGGRALARRNTAGKSFVPTGDLSLHQPDGLGRLLHFVSGRSDLSRLSIVQLIVTVHQIFQS